MFCGSALYLGLGQFSDVQKRIQRLSILSDEYNVRCGNSESENIEDDDFDQQEVRAETVPDVVEPVVVSQSDYKEIKAVQSSSDDDFVMLSIEEEKALAKTKAELARYRKKIAQQRLAKRAKKRSKRTSTLKKKKNKKKIAVNKKASSGRVRIPSMNQIKRRKVKNAFFDWPVDLSLFWLSSVYGPRKHPRGGKRFHYGIDLAALRGTPVMAAASGTVIQAQAVPGYGNNVIIKHNNQYKTRYAHLHKMYVKKGQKVKQGQKIAAVGATGYVRKSGRDASHLHFEIYSNGVHVNPLKYLLNE